ncbi:hypothetical protein [Thermococcus litoralis]|uniref:hypothetical protein n=1 Tax=Thermococcus litoralis TaxID=2265 RepID=UPI00117CBA71
MEESGGFGAWITIEVNGKRIVWAACYILQALAAIFATVAFAVASCDEIPYMLEKFDEEERRVIRRNCRGKKLKESFGTYEPVFPVVFRKEGNYLLIEAFENQQLVGRERVEAREYVKAALEFLDEYLKGTKDEAYVTGLERVKELVRESRYGDDTEYPGYISKEKAISMITEELERITQKKPDGNLLSLLSGDPANKYDVIVVREKLLGDF